MTVEQFTEVLKGFPKHYIILLNDGTGEYYPIKSIASRVVVEDHEELFTDFDEEDEFHAHMEHYPAITLSDDEGQL
jgi:hypothetical protein